MRELLELDPPIRILMGPGPSDVNPRVLKAMATPLIGHMDPEFIKIMDGIKEMLRNLFKTGNELTFAVSATGSAGMETTFVNLLEPGDEAWCTISETTAKFVRFGGDGTFYETILRKLGWPDRHLTR